MPLVGPATLRDGPAHLADEYYGPFRWLDANERWILGGAQLVDMRASLLPLDRTLAEAYDPYAFVRDAYLQHRAYAVYDGNPPAGAVKDEEADWGEAALREDEAAAGESSEVKPQNAEPPASDAGDATPPQ